MQKIGRNDPAGAAAVKIQRLSHGAGRKLTQFRRQGAIVPTRALLKHPNRSVA